MVSANNFPGFDVLFTLFLLIGIVLIPSINASETYMGFSYLLYADFYDNGTAILRNLSAINDYPSYFPSIEKDYKIEVYDYSSSLIFDGNLDVSFESEILYEPASGNNNSTEIPPTARLEMSSVSTRVPGFENATKIVVARNGETILDIDLHEYLCNQNGICELGESKYNCAEDCGSAKAAVVSKDTTNHSQSSYWPWVMPLLALLAVFLIWWFLRKNLHRL
jgi:hypothetical protein